MRRSALFLLLIIIIAAVPRLAWLGSWPTDGLNQDEAMRGYDAYSLLKTGKDHRGNPWPIYFEGFSDRRDNSTPLYVYSAIPSVAIFGLTPFATRLPAVVMGLISILFTYLLAKELFRDKSIALVSAALIAISPWHILISRFGVENITIPLFTSISLWCFLRGMRGNKLSFIISGALFGFSLYGYSPIKLFIPTLIIALIIIYRRELKKRKIELLIATLVFLLIISPLIYIQITQWDKIQGRFNEISILSQNYWPIIFFENYLRHSISFVYISLLEGTGLFIAIIFLFLKKRAATDLFRSSQSRPVLLSWLFLSPIAPSLTFSTSNILRSVALLPLLSILGALGIIIVSNKMKVARQYALFSFILVMFILGSAWIFFNSQTKFNFTTQQYGWNRVAEYVKNNTSDKDIVVITEDANQPHIFLLFYLQYDPKKLQTEGMVREYLPDGWQKVVSFDRFRFCNLDQCFGTHGSATYIAQTQEVTSEKGEVIWPNIDDTSDTFRVIQVE